MKLQCAQTVMPPMQGCLGATPRYTQRQRAELRRTITSVRLLFQETFDPLLDTRTGTSSRHEPISSQPSVAVAKPSRTHIQSGRFAAFTLHEGGVFRVADARCKVCKGGARQIMERVLCNGISGHAQARTWFR